MDQHALGLSNREIALVVGCHHGVVAYWLNKVGLATNLRRGRPPERVDAEHSRCSRCSLVELDAEFPFVRNRADGDRLSICRSCRAADARSAVGSSPAAYFRDKENRMRRSPKRGRIEFSLPRGYLVALWVAQDGLCFYTDTPMVMALGSGRDHVGVSADRADTSLGYIAGNVVLCCSRVNSIKSDATLAEMAEWMPGWHARIIDRIPELLTRLTVGHDRPLNAGGAALPQWIVERRARLAALLAESAS